MGIVTVALWASEQTMWIHWGGADKTYFYYTTLAVMVGVCIIMIETLMGILNGQFFVRKSCSSMRFQPF